MHTANLLRQFFILMVMNDNHKQSLEKKITLKKKKYGKRLFIYWPLVCLTETGQHSKKKKRKKNC